jgi:hypothetical protein
MSNNEYEQQQFWKDKDPWKEFGIAASNFIKVMYNTSHYKSALSMLTENHKNDNPTPYEWKLMDNYEYHKNKLDGK